MSASLPTEPMIDGKPLFIGVSGESGAGKTTFVEALIESQPNLYHRPRSVTTRQRRSSEGDSEYRFITPDEFYKLEQGGALINADMVYGNSYGIVSASLQSIRKRGMIPIKEMTSENALHLRNQGFFVVIIHLDAAYQSERLSNEIRPALRESIRRVPGSDFAVFLPKIDCPEICVKEFHLWLQSCVEFSNRDLMFLINSHENDELNRAGYDDVANEFTDDLRITTKFFHDLTATFWLDVVSARLRDEGSYLEIGPGRGWLRTTLRWSERCAYRAIDLAKNMVDLNEHSHLIDLGSSGRLPYERGNFDGVFGSLIEPSFTPDSLSEIRRVCKPKGWLGFTVPAGEWAMALREASTGLHRTSFALKNGRMAEVGSPCLTASTIFNCLKTAGYLNIQITTNEIDEQGAINAPPAILAAFAAMKNGAATLPITHCVLAARE